MRILFAILFFMMAWTGPLSAQEGDQNSWYQEHWRSKQFNPPEQSTPLTMNSGQTGHTVRIFPNDTIAPVLPTQLGLNTTFRSGSNMLYQRLDNYRNSNMGAFRFPAGSGSNIYFWDGNIPEEFLIDINPIDATQDWTLQVSEFAAFIDSLKAQATVNVNYFYARYGVTPAGTREARVNQAAEYAAGFVNYMNNELNAGIKNWEIGNECYGAWEEGYDVNGSIVTGKEYGEDLRIFAEKMKAVDPDINIGTVMYPKSDEWNDEVMTEVKEHADFLIVHNYFTGFNDATVENILASTVQVTDIKKQMEACVERNTSYPRDHFPVYMTEYNCRGPHTTTFVNACFTADVIGKLIQNNYALATRWVGEWKWKEGTHGLFALEDPDQVDYSVRQAYMVYHYFGKAFGDYMLRTECTNEAITVFGSSFSDGKTGLLVINPTGQTQQFNMETDMRSSAYLYEVYANSIAETDKKFYVNGLTSSTKGGGPGNFTSIAPYKFSFGENTKFEVKKYSVSFFVFDNVEVTSSKSINLPNQETVIYPVPASDQLSIITSQDFKKIEIYNTMGKMVLTSRYCNPLDLAEVPEGFYLMNLYSDSAQITKAFIKKYR